MILPMRHSTPTFPTVWMCTDLGAAHGPDAAALGLPEVLQLLAGEAKTAPGRRLCLQPELTESAARSRESYEVVAEALEAARLAEPPPFGHPLTSILDGVDEASGGAVLGVPALSEISAALVALEATAAWGAEPQRALASPRLASMAAEATPPARLLEVFAGAFEGDGSGGVRLSSKHFARLGQRRVRAEKTSRSTADAMRALLRCAPPFAAAAPRLLLGGCYSHQHHWPLLSCCAAGSQSSWRSSLRRVRSQDSARGGGWCPQVPSPPLTAYVL